jgi:hypothetical protein
VESAVVLGDQHQRFVRARSIQYWARRL